MEDLKVIYAYTRAEAIADGVLIDLEQDCFSTLKGSSIAREAGLRYPVAMTSGAYAAAIAHEGEPLPAGQDLPGRVWDVLWLLRCAIQRNRAAGPMLLFSVSVTNWVRLRDGRRIGERTKQETIDLKVMVGPGDDRDPVFTIMLPGED
jgi:hypothetical protein